MALTVFLTSSPTGPLDGSWAVEGLDRKNRFVENLRRRWPEGARCLIIAADPEEHGGNDAMAEFFARAVEESGLPLAGMDVWDDRVTDEELDGLHSYDVIILGGGHVPTQNAFFHDIELRERLEGFEGLVIGISAGTMNAAEWVYAQPELEGEADDPDYVRWLPGLGLTDINILPHYQMVKDAMLDGRRLFEDITYADSEGNEFLAIPDGSYVLIEDGRATLWGEGWRIADGELTLICREGEVR